VRLMEAIETLAAGLDEQEPGAPRTPHLNG